MAEVRINATGGLKLYDADDSHYAQIVAGTITSNVDAITLGHDTVTIADNLSLGSDSSVLKFGADGDTTLTHTDGTGLTLNSTNKICFNDASQFIQGSSNAILALGATDEIDLTATAVDLNGTLDVSGNSQFSGTVTVGVDDTGKDVKFFGASAGAYMEWDESADQLRIMGASADATTSTGKLLLATSLTDINANDEIGKIEFQAPHEAGGTDAITVAASIKAVAQSTFSSSSNATDLIFSTGHSEAAAEKIRITSQNEIGIAGANYGTDGQVLTSGGAGAAVAWEDAAGAGKILQVVTASTTTNANVATDSYTDTNLTADITPSSSSSKIYISCQQTNFNSGHTDINPAIRLLRDSTQIWGSGHSSGSTLLGLYNNVSFSGGANMGYLLNIQWVDSPSSTSALTYKTQMLNGNDTDGYCGTQNNIGDGTSAGHITLMEIDGS